MRIIYFTTTLYKGDGTSSAVFSRARREIEFFEEYLIVGKLIGDVDSDLNIVNINEHHVIRNFAKKGDLIIHYFKSQNSNILVDILGIVGHSVPLLTTVCQNPSYPNFWITPFEIHHSWHFVFIDKSAYCNNVVGFIPEEQKSQIYQCGTRKDYSYLKPDNHGDVIIYGRGSSSIKCPKEMFEVFDKIDVPNKLFRIVGIEGESWIKEEAAKHDNVEVYGHLPSVQWEEMCNSFDVFLYHLPKLCHSSIDGTLELAMLLGKPVVYMGCDAPAERFKHGENGFVANTVDEMAHYATLLGKDKDLREKIGEAGRTSALRDFRGEDTDRKYKEVYNLLKVHDKIRIPFSYYIKFLTGNKLQAKIYLRGVVRSYFPSLYRLYHSSWASK